jgi:transposase
VISVENWAEIRRLHRAEGVPIKAIARRLGISRNAVRRALAADGPPKYQRPARGSAFAAFEPETLRLLAEFPDMPASVLAQRVGWTGDVPPGGVFSGLSVALSTTLKAIVQGSVRTV